MTRCHYVPQFIIKAFDERPHVFDLKTGKVVELKASRIFFETDKYSEKVEALLNQQVEHPFSILVNGKLNDESPILTRDEIEIVKRYMLLASVRTMGEEAFVALMRGFASNAKRYCELRQYVSEGESFVLYHKLSIADLDMSDREIYLHSLERFCLDRTRNDLLGDMTLPIEMTVWATAFHGSYIGIWDAPEEKQFILTDCGMNSEYEGFRQVTGRDLSKFSYFLWLMNHGSQAERFAASDYAALSQAMFENFNFFPISSKRIVVAIHPFFKTFFPQSFVDPDGKPVFESKPECWPSCMETIDLFEPPSCQYVCKSDYSQDDKFVYGRKQLSAFETDYLNYLMCHYAKAAIAFDSPDLVKTGIMAFFWGSVWMRVATRGRTNFQEELEILNEEFESSPLKPLVDYLCDQQPKSADITIAIALFHHICELRKEDLHSNRYAARYVLSSPELLNDDKAFGFLGDLEKRKAFFEAITARLKPAKV